MPEEYAILREPKHWKAISHPLRLAVLDLLAKEELTNEEMADTLGEASGKLYFHTKKLLEAGLIELSKERRKGPLTEKVYRLTARGYRVPSAEGDIPRHGPIIDIAQGLYEQTYRRRPDIKSYGIHWQFHQTPEKEAEFYQRLKELCEDFAASSVDPSTPGAKRLALLGLLHEVEP